MAAKIIIKRIVPKDKKTEILPLIIQLRSQAAAQPGYVCGESLVNADNLEEYIVISTWKDLDCWRDWLKSPQRSEIDTKIEAILGSKTEYGAYFYGDIYLHQSQTSSQFS